MVRKIEQPITPTALTESALKVPSFFPELIRVARDARARFLNLIPTLRQTALLGGLSMASGCLPAITIEPDGDGDGYSWAESISDPIDCDDFDATVYPGADELCDGKDNDCDGEIDEDPIDGTNYYTNDDDADGFASDGSREFISCEELDAPTVAGDCDDDDALSYPGAPEQCDNVDNDCDGAIDESVEDQLWYVDDDGDGEGDSDSEAVINCAQPDEDYVLNRTDCDDTDPTVYSAADETCDDKDNDCDGEIDEEAVDMTDYYPDTDGDGYGDTESESVVACDAPEGEVSNADDCDDDNVNINPDVAEGEVCDNIDNDCSGTVDDLDNSNVCEVITANLSAGYTDSMEQDIDGDGVTDFYAMGTAMTPNEICQTAIDAVQADAAVATWWWECNGAKRLTIADLDTDLTVDWSTITSCTGDTLSEEDASGWPWEPNQVISVMTDTIDAYINPDGTAMDPESVSPGWDMAVLCQVE